MINVYGVDHKSSSIEYREKLVLAAGGRAPKNGHLFVTCNRFESYGSGGEADFGYHYGHHGEMEVYGHVLGLACGLKSQLLGERQIIDQLESFSRTTGAYLGRLIGRAIREAEKIRDRFSLNAEKTIADAVYRNALRRGLLGGRTVIAGTGTVAKMVAEKFHRDSPLCFVSGKHRRRAEKLAVRFNGDSIKREDLYRSLGGARVLICATASPHYVITREHPVEGCAIYDLSVPRNVDPFHKAIDLERLDDEFRVINSEAMDRVLAAQKEINERYGS